MLKFQEEHIEGLEGNGLNIIGRKQAQTMNAIVEVIYRMGANTSTNLMKVQRLNCTGFQVLRGGAIIHRYLELIFQKWRS